MVCGKIRLGFILKYRVLICDRFSITYLHIYIYIYMSKCGESEVIP